MDGTIIWTFADGQLNSEFTILETSTPASSQDKSIEYPDGFTYTNSVVLAVELLIGGFWRNCTYMANNFSLYGCNVSSRSNAIYIYPVGSKTFSVPCRIFIKRYK